MALLFFASPAGYSQTEKRVVEWTKPDSILRHRVNDELKEFQQIDDVQIEEILVEGKAITIGEPFVAPDDWFKNLTVRVKNVSNQRLLTIQLTIVLPEMLPGSPDIPYCHGCGEPEKTIGIAPGEVVELKMLGDQFYDLVVKQTAERGINKITKIEIHHFYVTPPNGPKWFSSCVKTLNPKNACPVSTP
jgi:hypothetical protein